LTPVSNEISDQFRDFPRLVMRNFLPLRNSDLCEISDLVRDFAWHVNQNYWPLWKFWLGLFFNISRGGNRFFVNNARYH